jgi:hypothetical protein
MFNGSKLKGETCLPENEIPAKAFPEDDLLTILAAKYDNNFIKNEPTR